LDRILPFGANIDNNARYLSLALQQLQAEIIFNKMVAAHSFGMPVLRRYWAFVCKTKYLLLSSFISSEAGDWAEFCW